MNTLEPLYVIPSRQHFSDKQLPMVYDKVKTEVVADLKDQSVSLTTDGWTSRATESFITITSCHIDEEWNVKNYVLQTRLLSESHTGSNIASVLKEAIDEWGISGCPPIVTDNASNMVVAIKELGSNLHIGCFAHTLNLACGRAIKLPAVTKLLARIRRIVSYFHRSTVAAGVLKDKQQLLQLPNHKLVCDVQTRWNSALDMTSRFLEQQPAVYGALTSKELRGKDKDISTLSENDIQAAEELVVVLNPLKDATTALCEENIPTLSVIIPLLDQLLNVTMSTESSDTELTKQIKSAIVGDLKHRYDENRNELLLASILDPRFKSVPFLSSGETMEIYYLLTRHVVSLVESEQCDTNISNCNSFVADSVVDVSMEDPNPILSNTESISSDDSENVDCSSNKKSKPSVMSNLFGDLYKAQTPDRPIQQLCEDEITAYKKENTIDSNSNPLDWWRKNCHKYPSIARLARKYLAIPATSVPSERVFSTAGDILTAQRSVLKAKHVDKLLFLKKNWKTD